MGDPSRGLIDAAATVQTQARNLRVMVIGGYGLIGGYVTAALAGTGCEVVGAGRDIARARLRFPSARWVRAELGVTSPERWRELLVGVDAVVNCAGALQDSPRDRLAAVHVEGLAALLDGARNAGVRRIVHISAVGVDAAGDRFIDTKRAGERVLARSGLEWVVLRPGLVLAPAAFGGTALLRGLAAFPGIVPAIHPHSRILVVAATDVARAVLAALVSDDARGATIDLVAPQAHRLDDLLVRLRRWLGLAPAPVVPMPEPLAQLTAAAADGLAWLGWRSPMRSTAVRQLRRGVLGDAQGAVRLGLRLKGLDEILAETPSGVQERWFARLYFAKPLVMATLATFWLASGLIGALRAETAAAVLAAAGASPRVAAGAVWAGVAADLLLGAAVCVRSTAPAALRGMVLVTAAYLVGATIWRPDLWLDPLGPLVKAAPAAILALVALALMDER